MSNATVQEKIFRIEKELKFIKQVFGKEPNFEIDEKNWTQIKSVAKKIRRRLYQEHYGKRKGIYR